MKTTQISVFLENRKGTLKEVTELLAENGVNIRALSLADTTEFGILRIIVPEPDRVQKMLRENGFISTSTEVLSICVDDKPGGLAGVAKILTESDIQIEYMYAFLSRIDNRAYVVMRVDDENEAIKLLSTASYTGFGQE